MAAALRLSQLQAQQGGEPLSIAVLEKARETGAHSLSGAVLDPSALRRLVPDFEAKGAPLAAPVEHEAVYFLTRTGKLRAPIIPPPLQNHGNYIISLSRFVKWLGGLVEAESIDVFTGFPAAELLYDGTQVIGVRTGDRGIGRLRAGRRRRARVLRCRRSRRRARPGPGRRRRLPHRAPHAVSDFPCSHTTIMTITWTESADAVDWNALSELYRLAPLGDKSADWLRRAFGNSMFKCFAYDGERLVALGLSPA